jgi:perosamine synthetase
MISLYKPTFKRKDMDAVLSAMVDENLLPAQKYEEFSILLTRWYRAEGCLILRSYIRAAATAFKLAGIGSESAVIISPLSPVWYVDLLQRMGSRVLLADVELSTGCMASESILNLSSEHPSAVVLRSPFGNGGESVPAAIRGIPIIEDMTKSFGSDTTGRGTGAGIYITAFEEDGVITTGGGAAVLTMDKKFSRPLSEAAEEMGNLEMISEIQAALGISQFKAMESLVGRRREYYQLFRNALGKTRHKPLLLDSQENPVNASMFPVLLDSRVQDVLKYTKRYKIETINPFDPCALDRFPEDAERLPNAAALRKRTLQFPLYPMLTQEQLKILVKVLSTLP